MIRLPVDGVEKDYIKIAYAGSDCLYVPATQLDLVSKYIGSGEDTSRTKLNKLGGTEWAKTTYRAKAAARDLAKGLIDLYARRQRLAGFAFSPDSPWQTEFEEAFPYAETGDQLQAIADIKKDMEQPRPMDRLLCGDVGYGKTEVALRAVMKCILDGKQAAILVPTTVLAQQHYATACGRFRDFPVKIEVLSRFTTAKELAAGLIQLYAQRQRQPGFAFSPDSPWQREFEDAFDYEETGDQLRAIEEIKGDMEKAVPMDRLLCGDVGYGKTEVALRAVLSLIHI